MNGMQMNRITRPLLIHRGLSREKNVYRPLLIQEGTKGKFFPISIIARKWNQDKSRAIITSGSVIQKPKTVLFYVKSY